MGFKRIRTKVSELDHNKSTFIDYTPRNNNQSVIVTCDICGFQFTDVHCKLKCTKCGYMRDCSDP